MKKDWSDDAACRGPLRKLFWNTITEDQSHRYPLPDTSDSPTETAAKEVCLNDCPVQADCLTTAYLQDERFGVWGGANSRERILYLRKFRKEPTP